MTADEMLGKIVAHLREQPGARLGISVHDGEFSTAYEFGEETPGSPMYAGASYGMGSTLEDALGTIIEEVRLT